MRPLYFATCALLAACSPTFDDGHLLDELRILAVRADPPEVGVGDDVELRALVVTTDGLPVTTHFWQCAARGGMRQGCETFDDSHDLGVGLDARMTIGPEWQDRLDRIGLPVQQVVTVIATTAAEQERAIKRVVVSEETTRNHNPGLEALLLGDEEAESGPFHAQARQSVAIHPIVAEGSAEHYDKIELTGERVPTVETFFVSYYYTCGKTSPLKSGAADELDATFRAPAAAGRCDLYAILRDDRGGVDWRVREISVE
jgi:hypothetical protein